MIRDLQKSQNYQTPQCSPHSVERESKSQVPSGELAAGKNRSQTSGFKSSVSLIETEVALPLPQI